MFDTPIFFGSFCLDVLVIFLILFIGIISVIFYQRLMKLNDKFELVVDTINSITEELTDVKTTIRENKNNIKVVNIGGGGGSGTGGSGDVYNSLPTIKQPTSTNIEKIIVSDDEENSDDDEEDDEDSDEDSDGDDDEDSEDDDEEDCDDDNNIEIINDVSISYDDVIKLMENSSEGNIKKNIIDIDDEDIPETFDIDDEGNSNDIKVIKITTPPLEEVKAPSLIEQIQPQEIIINKVNNDEVVEHMDKINNTTTSTYKKHNLNKLKDILLSKGYKEDMTNLKKNDIIKILDNMVMV